MPDCPYPDCAGEVKISSGVGVGSCAGCWQPVFECPKCQARNRAFARYCRRCKARCGFPERPPLPDGPALLAAFAGLPGEILAKDQFWVAPVPCCGYLWSLSTRGVVWKTNPAERRSAEFAHLGEGFGHAPFCIRPLVTEEGRPADPHLIAANGRMVKSINLANQDVCDWITAAQGSRLLSNLQTDGYLAVEADGEHVYALDRGESGCHLVRRNSVTAAEDDFFVSTGPVGGPFRLNGRVCVYSQDSLFVLGDAGLTELHFPTATQAIVYPRDARAFQLASGMPPWRTPHSRNDVYLPVLASKSPAYFYLNVLEYPGYSSSYPVPTGSAFSRDAEDRLVMTKPGSIEVFNGPIPGQSRHLDQVVPKGAEYLDGRLTAIFFRPAGAGEKIRFFYDDKSQDAALPERAEMMDPIGFFRAGASLVFAYFKTDDSSLGFAVWDV